MATISSSVAPPAIGSPLLTADDLSAMPDEKQYELVAGRLVKRKMGNWAGVVSATVSRMVGNFNAANPSGYVLNSDAGYRIFPESVLTVRKPDVSFVRFGGFPGGTPSTGYDAIVPDLAVEVLSPNDLAYEVDEKREEYRQAGVPLVWIINPQTKTVQICRADGSVAILHEPDELSGEAVLPGFRCQVADLFSPPAPTNQ